MITLPTTRKTNSLKLFDDFDDMFSLSPLSMWKGFETNISPRLDVFEDKDNVYVKAEMPGLNKEDIDVTLRDGTLSISAEKHSEKEETDKHYHVRQISSSSFSKSIRLGNDLAEDKISARYTNGILELKIPKQEVEKPKTKKVRIE